MSVTAAEVRLPQDVDHPLLFEMSARGASAVSLTRSDVPPVDRAAAIGNEFLADGGPDLPEIGELDLVRHYTRLAHRLFSVDGPHFRPYRRNQNRRIRARMNREVPGVEKAKAALRARHVNRRTDIL